MNICPLKFSTKVMLGDYSTNVFFDLLYLRIRYTYITQHHIRLSIIGQMSTFITIKVIGSIHIDIS